MIPLALLALTNCVAVPPESGTIMARDLAPVLPGLADAAVEVSPAPIPGVPRVFRIPELRRIAAHFGLAADPSGEICFERPVAPPDAAHWREAMLRQLPDAQIRILDYGRMPVPAGEVEFPLTGLRRAVSDGFWSGSVRYAGNRRFPIWARVRVSVRESRVLAAEDLRPGQPITAGQLRVETREVFPGEKTFATSVEPVTGRAARLAIPAGATIRLDWLAPAQDVVRGDQVLVEVHSGGAYLKFEATAEASGSVGQVILVTNPVSKKRFSARVDGKGRVTVGKGPS
jgi:flagella basal body P-ring formation protein FlgA